MMRALKALFLLLVFGYLYVPIGVLIANSFNLSK
jgi:spermidine/putrescine transport system permease protein